MITPAEITQVRAQIGFLPETPPLYTEMTVRDYLIAQGLPSASVVAIPLGHTSYTSLRAAATELRARQLTSAFLVSDPWHNLRIERMASDVGIEGTQQCLDIEYAIREGFREIGLDVNYSHFHNGYLNAWVEAGIVGARVQTLGPQVVAGANLSTNGLKHCGHSSASAGIASVPPTS